MIYFLTSFLRNAQRFEGIRHNEMMEENDRKIKELQMWKEEAEKELEKEAGQEAGQIDNQLEPPYPAGPGEMGEPVQITDPDPETKAKIGTTSIELGHCYSSYKLCNK